MDSPAPRTLSKKRGNTGATVSERAAATQAARQQREGDDVVVDDYTSPVLQRSRARMLERESFLREYETSSNVVAMTRNIMDDARKKKNEEEEKEEKEAARLTMQMTKTRGITPRTRKLWDLESPVSEEYISERRDDDDDDNDSNDDDGQSIDRDDDDDDASSEAVWDSARIRRELRRDNTKKASEELGEMEQFTHDMRRRIRHYTSPVMMRRQEDGTRVVVVEDEKVGREGIRTGGGRREEEHDGGGEKGQGKNGGIDKEVRVSLLRVKERTRRCCIVCVPPKFALFCDYPISMEIMIINCYS